MSSGNPLFKFAKKVCTGTVERKVSVAEEAIEHTMKAVGVKNRVEDAEKHLSNECASGVFDLFDKNKDGKIDEAELASSLKAIGGKRYDHEVSEVISKTDKNNDGVIDIEEFNQVLHISSNIETKLKNIFENVLDKDQNGFVSSTEVLRAWTELGEPLSDEQIDEIVRVCDKDGDGQIGLDEFVRTFKNTTMDALDSDQLKTALRIDTGVSDLWDRVDHVALVVSDVGRSTEFYGLTLGLEQVYRPDFDRYGAWFKMKNIELHLIKGIPAVHQDDDLIVSHLALDIGTDEDMEKCMDRLDKMGVKYRRNMSVPNPGSRELKSIKQAFVRDPDGYYIEFGSFDSLHNAAKKFDGGLDLNSIGIALEMKKLAIALKTEIKNVDKKTFDPEKLEKLLKRQTIFGDITQSASEEQLKELLILFDNDVPSVISGLKFLAIQKGGPTLIPPPFIERDGKLTQPPSTKISYKE